MGSANLDLLFEKLRASSDNIAITRGGQQYTYTWLLEAVDSWQHWLSGHGVQAGNVVLLRGDYSPNTIAMFLALAKMEAIIVPYAQHSPQKHKHFLKVSQAEYEIEVQPSDHVKLHKRKERADHPLYRQLREGRHPGLVLFSSGTTGESKGLVHDLDRLLLKSTRIQSRHLKILAFLIFDHMGGIDTLLYSLASAGTLVVPEGHRPDDILRTAAENAVEVLPTSPTFLALALLSGAIVRHDLRSLKKITYGAEPMPEIILKRLHQLLPYVKLTQTYGLTEVGVLRSHSKASDSLWMEIGGEEYQTRVVDGILQVYSPCMMLGCLNSPSEFTDDGWFITGDLVQQEGSQIRIIGRQSDVINVGGEKVMPGEVENVILELREILSAEVYGEPHPLTGNMVCAIIILADQEKKEGIIDRVRKHCLKQLAKYQVPVKISISYSDPYDARFKKARSANGGSAATQYKAS